MSAPFTPEQEARIRELVVDLARWTVDTIVMHAFIKLERVAGGIDARAEARALDPVASQDAFIRLAEGLRNRDQEDLPAQSSRKSRPHGGQSA